MPDVDVLIANEEDAADVFGIRAENTDVTSGKVDPEGYRRVAEKLVGRFGFKKVAVTLRESLSASDNLWAGMLFDGRKRATSPGSTRCTSWTGGRRRQLRRGLIYALLSGYEPGARWNSPWRPARSSTRWRGTSTTPPWTRS